MLYCGKVYIRDNRSTHYLSIQCKQTATLLYIDLPVAMHIGSVLNPAVVADWLKVLVCAGEGAAAEPMLPEKNVFFSCCMYSEHRPACQLPAPRLMGL